MGRGDHLRVRRSTGYWHHGIDLGNNRVVHYAADAGSLRKVSVCICGLDEFRKRGTVEVVTYAQGHPPDVVVARALSRLGEHDYNLITNNCEQFATWCKAGPGGPNVLRLDAAPPFGEVLGEAARATPAVALLGTMRGLAALCGWFGVAAFLDLYRAWLGRRVGVGLALALPAVAAITWARMHYVAQPALQPSESTIA